MTMQADFAQTSSNGVPRFVQKNRLLIACVALQTFAAFLVSRVLGIPFELHTFHALMSVCFQLVPVTLTLLLILHFAYLALIVRPERPIQRMIADAKSIFLDWERMATGSLALMCFVFFIGSFTFLKSAIPQLVPFSWDVTFAEWDRALHFGVDPYKLVLGLMGTPLVATVINVAYHWWFFMMYFLLIFACFTKINRQAASTFLVSTVLVWFLGGNVLATVFSSAGPVYFERMGLGTDFVALTDALKSFNQSGTIWALDVHEMLWKGYVAEGTINGISAMPSMHVASTVLMTLYAFSFGRWAGRAMLAFLSIILIGSVMLAWHYAIDGYFGALIAVLVWMLSKRLVALDSKSGRS
ncbi:phosphatase PAP2 family protein [uncultured Shimia sp.]|uniref:phosphatase PAP2 family protein n=1 Tax=uncultured Shimia sp. TaxID=573152 RepID=UPI002617A830|nr:phosphatase PAP2 family protein [uncultured Shimia sp.]